MNRRQFVTSLGVFAPTGAVAAQPDVVAQAGPRSQVGLNGTWQRYVGGTLVGYVEVPSSLRPSGYYRLKRSFVLPKLAPAQRAVAHFDAINYHGRVFVNGVELGTSVPYVPHEFEFTREAREGANEIEVAIADLCPEPGGSGADEVWLGVNPGWEGYGGIVRSAYVEIRPAAYIENARLSYQLSADYASAACRITAFLASTVERGGEIEVVLRRGPSVMARAKKTVLIRAGAAEADLEFVLKDVALWSPETPNLYELAVTLRTDAGDDQFRCRTGFREFVARGRSFELNGSRVVLNGICRHDMWKDQGFTLTRPQMEQDMRAIKALGANFIRLVHYPHDRYIVELADQLGLLVSEEPGFWGMDFRTMPWSRAELGLHILEKTIRRDWNSPAVAAWLLGNESEFIVDYLSKGKAMCLALDPIARPISIANIMSPEHARTVCEQSGMDFFDQHPYTFDVASFDKIAAAYGPGKPLLFTEWGGREIGQSAIIMPHTVDQLLDMTEKGTLAGHAFWSWQDLPQFSRIDPEMRDGILESGVVTEGREPRKPLVMELKRLFEDRRQVSMPVNEAPAVVPLRHTPWSPRGAFDPIDLSTLVNGARGSQAWSDFESHMAKFWSGTGHWERTGKHFWLWKNPEIEILGVRFANPMVDGWARPLVVTPAFPEVEIPVNSSCTRLHFLGHVTCPQGFPVDGAPEEVVASYEIRYEDGKTLQVPLRGGFEVARANSLHASTRVDPVATGAQRALWFVKDWTREQYQVLLFSVPTESRRVRSVRWILSGKHPMMLFALTAERA
jgi:hypothetical protein